MKKGIYKATKEFPGDERYGLTSQLRRATVSIPSNTADGYRRKTTLEYALQNFFWRRAS